MPGVVIIDEILHGLTRKNPNIKVDEIVVIKFLKPLIPNIVVVVNVSEMKPGLLQVTLHQNEMLIVSGQLRMIAAEST